MLRFWGWVLFFAVLIMPSVETAANNEFRKSIRIVGSSTVFPFSAYVAEKYHRKTGIASPVVESTGSGGGIKMFCAGIGKQHPDIVTASRRMKISEVHKCVDHKITSIGEVMIGWDGIILAVARHAQPFEISQKILFKALARKLPIDGQWVNNPHTKWNHIDPALPEQPIQVFGPPPTSGTRDVFVEEVMLKACRQLLQQPDIDKRLCGDLRDDGHYIDAGEDDDLIVRRLNNNAQAIGILGYNAAMRRENLIKPLSVNAIAPSFETILDATYPLSRPLFLYVKNEHIKVLPNIQDYLDEFLSEQAIGEEGYLVEKGLIPLLNKNAGPRVLNLSLQ
ncbi:substrate-binding domain-containing protein [Terasakiella sp. SH-1]|uniref:substrate-binding domain-containing protein n=1 Tax=Terasakiella sp. SH-1 TaxID=2560057 RepID=UPI0010741795|nr:substrate-binding domain-containing protein [Terasakiella sp. SH-1]